MKQSLWNVMIAVILLGAMPLWAAGTDEGYALLIQQSPPDGGSVTPGSGVHRTPIGDTVSLSAVPKPGYRFMYWLGDVKNASSVDTTIAIDSPKMVVAVFAREHHDEDLPGLGIVDGVASQGGGGRYAPSPMMAAGSVSPASGPADYDYPNYIPDDQGNDDVPIPEVPEPTTILLFGLGAVLSLRRK